MPDESLIVLCREAYRVLKPGGGIRFECPDAEFLRDAYGRRDPQVLGHFQRLRKRELVDELGLNQKYLEPQLTYVGEISSYIDREQQSRHIPVYAIAEEVDARLDWDIERFSAWAQSLKTDEQAKSGGHNNAISFEKLRSIMSDIGFCSIQRVSMGQTTIEGLSLNDRRRRWNDSVMEKPHRAFYSLYIEAKKPSLRPEVVL